MYRVTTSLLLITAVGLVASGAVTATADEMPTVQLSVSVERNVVPDALYRASFVVNGACLDANDDVAVTRRECPPPEEPELFPPVVEGSVRNARLGFHAYRRAEAVPADLPLAETAQAAAPEQSTTAVIDLVKAGDLTVRISGRAAAGLDPQPVAGSASSGGQIEDRSVVWQQPAAAPGTYTFSARFRPGATPGFTGTFLPEVTVERRGQESSLLESTVGVVPSDGPVQRTSTLTMLQHVAPASGPPAMSTTPFYGVRGASGVPEGFEASVAMDARGQYQSTVSGALSASRLGLFEDLAPGATGVVDTAWIASGWYDLRGMPKARPFMDFDKTPEGKPAGFVGSVQTSPTADAFAQAVGGSTIWDGDTQRFGIFGGIHELDGPAGTPSNSNGTLAADWDGDVTYEWSGLWANPVPGAEPNRLNPYQYPYGPQGLSYNILHVVSATIPSVVTGGDIDNRSGGGTVTGETVMIPYPPGQVAVTGISLNVWLPETNYQATGGIRPGGFRTFTPTMRPGGYWLESSREGYDREWSNVSFLNTFTDRPGALNELGEDVVVVHAGLALIPPGAAAEVVATDVATGQEETLPLSPGTWRVSWVTGEELSAIRIA